MENIMIFIVLLLFILCFGYIIYKIIRTSNNLIRYNYDIPKYRIGERGYVEYYIADLDYWDQLCGWDNNETERVCLIYGVANHPIEIKYKGPGRVNYYFDKNLSSKELKEEVEKFVIYKTGKECYNHQMELINNENIILRNKINIKYGSNPIEIIID